MSNVYINEPPTNGKVCLHTTVGDIDIELWSKEAPKACRNFIQLCMEGYYNRTIFHRVVKDFIVQGGDPTGTGHGGDSIYGAPFKDEFHQRLRFNRRGLVAMANAGKNDNESQFFFTLGVAEDLDRKHTIFGKVVGDTLFNMVTLGEGEVDHNERPLVKHEIKSAEILLNPFDDIVPRKKEKNKKTDSRKDKIVATKNLNLLSFGDEMEDDDEEGGHTFVRPKGVGKSAHELLKDDEKLSAEPAVRKGEMAGEQSSSDDEDVKATRLTKIREKLKKRAVDASRHLNLKEDGVGEEDLDKMLDDERSTAAKEEKIRLQKEQRSIKRELIRALRRTGVSDDEEEEEERPEAVRDYYQQRQEYMMRSKVSKKRTDKTARESETMRMLEAFRSKIDTKKTNIFTEEKMVPLHREKKFAADIKTVKEKEKDEEDSDEEGDDWMRHRFDAGGEPDGLKDAKDANMRNTVNGAEDWFDINDPRNPINRRRRGEKVTDANVNKARKLVDY